MTSLPDYAEWMDRLRDPSDWDIPALVADAVERANACYDDELLLAVLDTLVFRMRDIAELISHKHAKRINQKTVREAAEIAAMFVSKADQSNA